jgi:hypothetical protein
LKRLAAKKILRTNNYSKASIVIILITLLTISFKYNLWNESKLNIDAPSYYGYLPAIFIYHDVHLEFVTQDPQVFKDKIWFYRIGENQRVLKHPLGLALVLSPFFHLAHVTAILTGQPTDGFSLLYQNFVMVGVWVYLILGLFLLRKFLLEFFSDKHVALSLIAIIIGTNFLWYSSFEPLMSHSVTFSIFCILNYFFCRWIKSGILKYLLVTAICFAIVVLLRPLNILSLIYFLIVAFGMKGGFKELCRFLKSRMKSILLASVVFLFLVSLQFIYWKLATGQWFYNTYIGERFLFNKPEVFSTLFGFRKGLFIYTPILLFAVVGMIYLFKTMRGQFWAITLTITIVVFVLSSWWDWSYGISWGIRPLVDYYAFLALPIAAAFAFLDKGWMRIAKYFFLVIFISLNLFQTWQYKNGLIHYDNMNAKAYTKGFLQTKASAEWIDLLKPYNFKKRLQNLPQTEYGSTLINNVSDTTSVCFRGFNQYYFTATAQSDFILLCNFNSVTEGEMFYINHLNGDTVAIRAHNGKYLSVKPSSFHIVIADADSVSDTEKFILSLIDSSDNRLRIQTMDNRYLSVTPKFPFVIRALEKRPGNDEVFRFFLAEDIN